MKSQHQPLRTETDVAKLAIPEREVTYTTARSGGPGGQNVNKVETKVSLHFTVCASQTLTEAQKAAVIAKLTEASDRRFDGWRIVVTSQEHRTQGANKRAALAKLNSLLQELTMPSVERIATEAPAYVDERRHNEKRRQSEVKGRRGQKTRDLIDNE